MIISLPFYNPSVISHGKGPNCFAEHKRPSVVLSLSLSSLISDTWLFPSPKQITRAASVTWSYVTLLCSFVSLLMCSFCLPNDDMFLKTQYSWRLFFCDITPTLLQAKFIALSLLCFLFHEFCGYLSLSGIVFKHWVWGAERDMVPILVELNV